MQIIIPMSGLGSRFAANGYQHIKPLIPVMGKPIIEWVCDLFPGDVEFLFICREEHLLTTNLKSELNRIKPEGKIVAIPGHKLGPVYAVHLVAEHIHDDEEVIVNYCDFFMDWDFQHFRNIMTHSNCEGAIPCYSGFHPHLLNPENVYAVCRTDTDDMLLEIREKYRFNPAPQDNNHSAGTYYFRNGKRMKQLFSEMLQRQDLALNGEFYVSLAYCILLEKAMPVHVYKEVPYFCQWGTPADLEEFLKWKKIFETIKNGTPVKENLQS